MSNVTAPAGYKRHVVGNNETFSEIARDNGVKDWRLIAELHDEDLVEKPQNLRRGDVLLIPTGALHTVSEGQSLEQLAAKLSETHGDVTPESLLRANPGLRAGTQLRAGQQVLLRRPPSQTSQESRRVAGLQQPAANGVRTTPSSVPRPRPNPRRTQTTVPRPRARPERLGGNPVAQPVEVAAIGAEVEVPTLRFDPKQIAGLIENATVTASAPMVAGARVGEGFKSATVRPNTTFDARLTIQGGRPGQFDVDFNTPRNNGLDGPLMWDPTGLERVRNRVELNVPFLIDPDITKQALGSSRVPGSTTSAVSALQQTGAIPRSVTIGPGGVSQAGGNNENTNSFGDAVRFDRLSYTASASLRPGRIDLGNGSFIAISGKTPASIDVQGGPNQVVATIDGTLEGLNLQTGRSGLQTGEGRARVKLTMTPVRNSAGEAVDWTVAVDVEPRRGDDESYLRDVRVRAPAPDGGTHTLNVGEVRMIQGEAQRSVRWNPNARRTEHPLTVNLEGLDMRNVSGNMAITGADNNVAELQFGPDGQEFNVRGNIAIDGRTGQMNLDGTVTDFVARVDKPLALAQGDSAALTLGRGDMSSPGESRIRLVAGEGAAEFHLDTEKEWEFNGRVEDARLGSAAPSTGDGMVADLHRDTTGRIAAKSFHMTGREAPSFEGLDIDLDVKFDRLTMPFIQGGVNITEGTTGRLVADDMDWDPSKAGPTSPRPVRLEITAGADATLRIEEALKIEGMENSIIRGTVAPGGSQFTFLMDMHEDGRLNLRGNSSHTARIEISSNQGDIEAPQAPSHDSAIPQWTPVNLTEPRTIARDSEQSPLLASSTEGPTWSTALLGAGEGEQRVDVSIPLRPSKASFVIDETEEKEALWGLTTDKVGVWANVRNIETTGGEIQASFAFTTEENGRRVLDTENSGVTFTKPIEFNIHVKKHMEGAGNLIEGVTGSGSGYLVSGRITGMRMVRDGEQATLEPIVDYDDVDATGYGAVENLLAEGAQRSPELLNSIIGSKLLTKELLDAESFPVEQDAFVAQVGGSPLGQALQGVEGAVSRAVNKEGDAPDSTDSIPPEARAFVSSALNTDGTRYAVHGDADRRVSPSLAGNRTNPITPMAVGDTQIPLGEIEVTGSDGNTTRVPQYVNFGAGSELSVEGTLETGLTVRGRADLSGARVGKPGDPFYFEIPDGSNVSGDIVLNVTPVPGKPPRVTMQLTNLEGDGVNLDVRTKKGDLLEIRNASVRDPSRSSVELAWGGGTAPVTTLRLPSVESDIRLNQNLDALRNEEGQPPQWEDVTLDIRQAHVSGGILLEAGKLQANNLRATNVKGSVNNIDEAPVPGIEGKIDYQFEGAGTLSLGEDGFSIEGTNDGTETGGGIQWQAVAERFRAVTRAPKLEFERAGPAEMRGELTRLAIGPRGTRIGVRNTVIQAHVRGNVTVGPPGSQVERLTIPEATLRMEVPHLDADIRPGPGGGYRFNSEVTWMVDGYTEDQFTFPDDPSNPSYKDMGGYRVMLREISNRTEFSLRSAFRFDYRPNAAGEVEGRWAGTTVGNIRGETNALAGGEGNLRQAIESGFSAEP